MSTAIFDRHFFHSSAGVLFLLMVVNGLGEEYKTTYKVEEQWTAYERLAISVILALVAGLATFLARARYPSSYETKFIFRQLIRLEFWIACLIPPLFGWKRHKYLRIKV